MQRESEGSDSARDDSEGEAERVGAEDKSSHRKAARDGDSPAADERDDDDERDSARAADRRRT